MSKRRIDDDDTSSSAATTPTNLITCNYPPCVNNTIFNCYAEYELHVQNYHTHICNECKRRFPTNDFLTLHIDETHNPLLQIKRERGEKTYKCFNYSTSIGGCRKICLDQKKRRLHMIDKHGYPRDFKFNVINYGI